MFGWLKSVGWRKGKTTQNPECFDLVDGSARPVGHIGSRRQICFWEPIYSPEHVVALDPYDWDFDRDAGPSRRFISAPTLTEKIVRGDTFKVVNVTFKECDFQGHFSPDALLMFDKCTFSGCDFAYSDWKDTHFRECTFSDSSISLAEFEGCEFRDCIWERIGFGSKTLFRRCFIKNPKALISATVSLRNPKDRSLNHRIYQWYRLLGTRAHVLRTLMISHEVSGDEHTYYEIVKLHELQCPKARASEHLYNVCFLKGKRLSSFLGLISNSADYVILRTLGLLNNWGVSASRPCLSLAMCWGGFGWLYQHLTFSEAVSHPFQKSFDITFLVGYGNQISADSSLQLLQSAHALTAIVIYTVFFATVVSKLSRSR